MLKSPNRQTFLFFTVISAVSALALCYGWRDFWFLTDDAFIAFRYVSNSILGFGYTWNAPPFQPVEGYTSFLWVVHLDLIWRLTGVQPPESANYLSLLYSYLSLILTLFVTLRLSLLAGLGRWGLGVVALAAPVALVALGLLTNVTFLTWSSSGLETAMFNFYFLLWMVIAVSSAANKSRWLLGFCASAALVYLSRPDGILMVLATVALVGWRLSHWRSEPRWPGLSRLLLYCAPLLAPPIHLLWRLAKYGEWLPNTFYAKHVSAWPEAGLRYLGSFFLEYALWLWLGLVLVAVVIILRRTFSNISLLDGLSHLISRADSRLPLVVVVLTVLAHLGYYTLIIGGDHFEYRVYSYLPPLIFLSLIWAGAILGLKPWLIVVALVTQIAFSAPLPWTHRALTDNIISRDQSRFLHMRLAESFPAPFRWYVSSFDDLQGWLIQRHVCMRRQEHKAFYQYQVSRYPTRSLEVDMRAGKNPIMALSTVGVPGWVFPRIAIIDRYGLNDYVIARYGVDDQHLRMMAHDRQPPPEYLRSFLPNVELDEPKKMRYRSRPLEMTDEMIISLERRWRQWVEDHSEGKGG